MDVCGGCPSQNGFGGPDRSFWPDVRTDIRPKNFLFGLNFHSRTKGKGQPTLSACFDGVFGPLARNRKKNKKEKFWFRPPQKIGKNEPRNNPCVRKIRVRNSGAGNGCANFMDAWKNASVLQEKTVSIKFLVLGGGGSLGFGGGGGECRFYFYGRGDISENWKIA